MILLKNNKPMADAKMIKVSQETYNRLLKIGKMQDSFNDVITILLNEYEKN
jgi:predicted CopG family antitoxin